MNFIWRVQIWALLSTVSMTVDAGESIDTKSKYACCIVIESAMRYTIVSMHEATYISIWSGKLSFYFRFILLL